MSKNGLVVVHGSYFMNNFGDTLLIKLLCEKIAQYVGKENVRLACSGNKEEQASIGYSVIKDSEIGDVTNVFYSGGGYFGEPNVGFIRRWRWSIRNYNRHFDWSKPFNNAKFHIIGVGIGPIKNRFYRSSVRKFLRKCDDILVRDIESKNYCSKYFPEITNIDLCVDLALGTKNLNLNKNKISIHLDTSDSEIISDVLAFLKSRKDSEKLSFIFDNNVSYNERTIGKYKTVLANLGYKDADYEFVQYKDFDTLIAHLSSSKLVVTSKLHVGIITISQLGKVIAIPNHSKTKRLYSQLSISDYCIEKNDFNIDKFEEAYNKLSQFKPNYSLRDEGISLIDNRIKSIFTEKKYK